MKYCKVKVPLWCAEVFVYAGCTRQEAAADLIKRRIHNDFAVQLASGDDSQGACISNCSQVVIWSELEFTSVNAVGVLAHEALHATKSILDGREIKIDDSGEEAYAYLIQYLVEEILRKMS